MSNYCPPNQTEHRIQKWTPTGKYRPASGKFLGIGVAGQSIATRAWLHTFKGFSYVPGNVDELPILLSCYAPASLNDVERLQASSHAVRGNEQKQSRNAII